MTQRFLAEQVFDGERILTNAIIKVEGGNISEVTSSPTLAEQEEVLSSGRHLKGLVVPAFIDLQVNGGGGVLFNNSPTVDALETISQAHMRAGTGYILPTVITDDIGVMEQAADAVSATIRNNRSILGIHFEGPHLSVVKKGVHPKQFVRVMTERERSLYKRTDLGIKKITIAPESMSLSDLEFLLANNWLVSIGHTNADADTIQKYVKAGATCFTHLFNAMSAMTGREPGAVGTALLEESVYAGIILDGHHVDYRNGYLAWRLKNENKAVGSGRLFLVSDAMATSGVYASPLMNEAKHVAENKGMMTKTSQAKSFQLFGETLTEKDGKLTTSEGTLAGAHLTMLSAVQNSVEHTNIPLPEVLKMASCFPADYLSTSPIEQGPKVGYIKQGYQARFLLLDNKLNLIETFV